VFGQNWNNSLIIPSVVVLEQGVVSQLFSAPIYLSLDNIYNYYWINYLSYATTIS